MQWKNKGRVKDTHHVLWCHLVVNNDSVICYMDMFRPPSALMLLCRGVCNWLVAFVKQ